MFPSKLGERLWRADDYLVRKRLGGKVVSDHKGSAKAHVARIKDLYEYDLRRKTSRSDEELSDKHLVAIILGMTPGFAVAETPKFKQVLAVMKIPFHAAWVAAHEAAHRFKLLLGWR